MSVRIKDVAKEAGVSVATVSRALSGGPVSETLRKRVEKAVKSTGYRPNLSARRLRTQHTQTIGLIVSDILNPFFTAVARAVEDAAYQAGMRVILCNTDENPEREQMYLRLMDEERVTGVIFAPTLQMSTVDFDFPVVLIDRESTVGTHDCVVLDNEKACSELVQLCQEQGYTRIGGLFGQTSITGRKRHDAYCASMQAHGLEPLPRFILPTVDAAQQAVEDWLASEQRPEAVICSNGRILMGAAKSVWRSGLRLGREMALLGFDNEEWTELAGPGLTVVEQPMQEMGRTAMELLFDRLQNPEIMPRKVVLSGKCVVRGSTTRRPAES